MGNISYPNTLTNGLTEPNDADEVMANFDAITDEVNGNLEPSNMDSTLLDYFLKLHTAADIIVKWGTGASGVLNSGTPYSAYQEVVTHGMGRQPSKVWIIPTTTPAVTEQDGSGSGSLVPTWAITAKSSSSFTVLFTVPGVSNNSVGFDWVALG